MTTILPLLDKVAIRVADWDVRSPGGIFLARIDTTKPKRGIVFAVGEGVRLEDGSFVPLTSKVGDDVFFSSHRHQTVTVDNLEYVIIEEEFILCKAVEVSNSVESARYTEIDKENLNKPIGKMRCPRCEARMVRRDRETSDHPGVFECLKCGHQFCA